jgi:hypothetical protein
MSLHHKELERFPSDRDSLLVGATLLFQNRVLLDSEDWNLANKTPTEGKSPKCISPVYHTVYLFHVHPGVLILFLLNRFLFFCVGIL